MVTALGLPVLGGCLATVDLPPDQGPPQVVINSPANSATVGGTVPIDVSASDDYSVERIRILIDGTVMATFYARPYYFLWNTYALPANSTHTIIAEALDPSNNTGQAQITVTVLNNPQ